MKKYLAIYITLGSAPNCVSRVYNSKGWCTRLINQEDYRAECAKDFSRKFRLIIEPDALPNYIKNMVVTSYFEESVRGWLNAINNSL